MPKVADVFDRVAASPPGWPLHGLLILSVAWTLWQSSLPGLPLMPYLLLAMFLWGVLGLMWLGRLVVYLRVNRSWVPDDGHRLRWALAPTIVVVTALLVVFELPLQARFDIGREELDRYAKQIIASEQRDIDGRGPDIRIGTYRIKRWSVERFGKTGDGMRFFVEGTGIYGISGFAYSPDNRLRRDFDSRYYHLDGPWYVWEAGYD